MNVEPESKTNEYLKGIVANLPEKPGIYQYLNTEGTIIYVGKAKNLKKRVYSYFSKEHEPGKTRVLVSKIADIRYIVVNTEEDALLLENNLIKKYKPRYNVLLKDDKTYPSICVQNEYFPRIFKTRKVIRNGSSYYGPYSHIPSMYAVLDLIKHLYPLRTCNLNLSPENIRAGKFNVCLEYHIKNCAGPCIGLQSQEEYLKNIDEIKEILKGNTQDISRMLLEKMQTLAAEMKFEEAQKVKEKYLLIESYRSKSEVVSAVLHNIDVFSIEEDESNSAFINYLHITNGANAADCDGSCYCGAGQRAEHGVAHDVGVRQTAGDTAYKGLCKVDEPLCDTAGVHQNAGEDEERNGQQREAVNAGNHLLARNEGGQVKRQSRGNRYQRGND